MDVGVPGVLLPILLPPHSCLTRFLSVSSSQVCCNMSWSIWILTLKGEKMWWALIRNWVRDCLAAQYIYFCVGRFVENIVSVNEYKDRSSLFTLCGESTCTYCSIWCPLFSIGGCHQSVTSFPALCALLQPFFNIFFSFVSALKKYSSFTLHFTINARLKLASCHSCTHDDGFLFSSTPPFPLVYLPSTLEHLLLGP